MFFGANAMFIAKQAQTYHVCHGAADATLFGPDGKFVFDVRCSFSVRTVATLALSPIKDGLRH